MDEITDLQRRVQDLEFEAEQARRKFLLAAIGIMALAISNVIRLLS